MITAQRVRSGSRAAVAGRRIAQRVYPQLRRYPVAFRHLRFVPNWEVEMPADPLLAAPKRMLGFLTRSPKSPSDEDLSRRAGSVFRLIIAPCSAVMAGLVPAIHVLG